MRAAAARSFLIRTIEGAPKRSARGGAMLESLGAARTASWWRAAGTWRWKVGATLGAGALQGTR